MKILALGVATLDIINVVDAYPREDAKIRALDQHRQRGGNAANTLAVLSQMGHRCFWVGTLAQDAESDFIRSSLTQSGIDYRYAQTLSSGMSPTSYITLSKATGSRTVVHHRDLPEFPASAFDGIDLQDFDWVHLEGRNVPDLKLILEALAKLSKLPFSLEVEKAREGIEALFPYPSVIIFSREYVQWAGSDQAPDFLRRIQPQCREGALLICPWGDQGAYAIDASGQVYHQQAFSPEQLIDTLGAGDVFNAGVIDALVDAKPVGVMLEQACRLAGKKCGQLGFANLASPS